jgi:serine/threonine protein kinase
MPILTPHERIGSVVAGRYRLDSILGVGGMGVVFSSVHTWTGRPVAVKILSPEYALNEAVAQRFLQEARAAARLRHPNIVDVLDMGQDEDGTVFLVLELLLGESLGALIERESPIAPGRTIDLLVPVMKALYSVHRRGIIHRDVKPDNIFISVDETGNVVPKILDFGIAKITDSAHRGTHAGAVLGTPHYMSPEQAAGSEVGSQADVWSMGVTGNNPTAVLLAIACGNPVKLSVSAPYLPESIATAVDLALVPDRKTRYPTMREFVDALLAAAATSGIALQSASRVRSEPPPGLRPRGDESKRIELGPLAPRSGAVRHATPRSDPQAATIAADGAISGAWSESVESRPAESSARGDDAGAHLSIAIEEPRSASAMTTHPVVRSARPSRSALVAGGAALVVLALFLIGGWVFGDRDALAARPQPTGAEDRDPSVAAPPGPPTPTADPTAPTVERAAVASVEVVPAGRLAAEGSTDIATAGAAGTAPTEPEPPARSTHEHGARSTDHHRTARHGARAGSSSGHTAPTSERAGAAAEHRGSVLFREW